VCHQVNGLILDLICKRGSVGESEELLIPRSSVRFHLKPENSHSNGFELHRPSIKGTKLLLKVIKTIIIINGHVMVIKGFASIRDAGCVHLEFAPDAGCVHLEFAPYLARIRCPKVRCVHPSKWPFWLRALCGVMTFRTAGRLVSNGSRVRHC